MDDLAPEEFPDGGQFVWSVWVDLQDSRQPGMSGPAPLTYLEIQAYCNLTGTILWPSDVKALKQLDRVFREVFADNGGSSAS